MEWYGGSTMREYDRLIMEVITHNLSTVAGRRGGEGDDLEEKEGERKEGGNVVDAG
jgi:hypothetical protein